MDTNLDVFEALSDPTRVKILSLLAEKGELCVCNIFEALDMSQPRISRHLAVLRKTKVVTSRRSGRWIYYTLDSSRLHDAMSAIDRIVQTSINSSFAASVMADGSSGDLQPVCD